MLYTFDDGLYLKTFPSHPGKDRGISWNSMPKRGLSGAADVHSHYIVMFYLYGMNIL